MFKTKFMIKSLFKPYWNFLILICADHNFKKYGKGQKAVQTYTIRIYIFCKRSRFFQYLLWGNCANCVLYKDFKPFTEYDNLWSRSLFCLVLGMVNSFLVFWSRCIYYFVFSTAFRKKGGCRGIDFLNDNQLQNEIVIFNI